MAERTSTSARDGNLVLDGTMGPPTHWDYSVSMSEADVLDFVELLKQPAPARFVTEADAPGALVRTALVSGIVFAWNTVRCFLGLVPSGESDPSTAAKVRLVQEPVETANETPGKDRS
ncbi:MAG: hypothetical protein GY723_19385 [bacterium]|nr:hypothetical protein [bacterium]MCP5065932.1 hypothetical protein [bacterium]